MPNRVYFWFKILLLGAFFSVDRSALVAADGPYQFRYQAAQVGDHLIQHQEMRMQLQTSLFQLGTKISSSSQQIAVSQVKRLQLLEVSASPLRVGTLDGQGTQRVTQANVTFVKSERSISVDDPNAVKVKDPVHGRSYRATRVGEKLSITDMKGKIPPENELKILAQSLAGFGRPNPLALYLRNRQVAIGQRLQLPKELASELFAVQEQFGEIASFELVLTGEKQIGTQRCVVFETQAAMVSPKNGASSAHLTGQVWVDPDTCRSVYVKVQGPVSIEQQHGPKDLPYQLLGQGKFSIAVRAEHRTLR